MGILDRILFHFSGIFHVYDEPRSRSIEELFFTVHDTRFPSQYLRAIDAGEELSNGCFYHQLLELKEIKENKSEEFYFEITGSGYIEYSKFETYDGPEHDVEYILEDYKLRCIDEKIALELVKRYEVDEDVLNAVLEEENNKTERIFRD
jgi:hypothetical protein